MALYMLKLFVFTSMHFIIRSICIMVRTKEEEIHSSTVEVVIIYCETEELVYACGTETIARCLHFLLL